MAGGAAAAETTRALIRLLPPKDQGRTITADHSKELAGHSDVAEALDRKFYFAQPHCLWERGSKAGRTA